MPKEYLCDYGNCSERDVKILISGDETRRRYCSWLHAALSCLRNAAFAQRVIRDREFIDGSVERLETEFGKGM